MVFLPDYMVKTLGHPRIFVEEKGISLLVQLLDPLSFSIEAVHEM
jgi:hypothetical protein